MVVVPGVSISSSGRASSADETSRGMTATWRLAA